MIDFLISFLLFLVALFMSGMLLALFVVIASIATGAFLACFVTPIDAAISSSRGRERRDWETWTYYTGCASAVVWTIFAVTIFVTTKNEMMADARWALTFGYAQRSAHHAPVIVLKTEIRRYKLLGYNPPKHFYVDLEDVETKQVYNQLYVSKHCNSHANNKLGDLYNISVTTKQQNDKTWLEFNNMYHAFCE
jgi:hypothetical protein